MIILEFPTIKNAASFRISKRMYNDGKFEEWETVDGRSRYLKDLQVASDQKYDYHIEILDANEKVIGSTTITGWTKAQKDIPQT
jgi:hypothetical protein